MRFSGRVVKSFDPCYEIKFNYYCGKVTISRGYAKIVRKPPKLEITYDSVTTEKLTGVDTTEIEYEFTNLILKDLLIGRKYNWFT